MEKFRSEELSNLFFADDEVVTIAELFNGSYFVNNLATKNNLLSKIRSCGFLHISAHSCVDYFAPENSAIVLSRNKEEMDNLLKFKDILGLDLKCQMVTLSACSTSSGKLYDGEGVSSLAKAFFEAGSSSVVGSYWSVPDEVSKIFMESFYKKLQQGKDKDVALREVKLELAGSNSKINPYYRLPPYWASWVVYGNVDALRMKDYSYLYLIASFIALLIAFFFYKKVRG